MSAKHTLLQWLADGETDRIIDALPKVAQQWGDTYFTSDATLLSGRYNGLKKDRGRGILDEKQYQIQINGISVALEGLIRKIPDSIELPQAATPPSTPPAFAGTVSTSPAPAGDSSGTTSTSPTTPPSNSNIPWIIGLVLLAGSAIALIGFVPNPTKSVEITFRLIMALGAAGIATTLPGFLNIEFTGIKAGSALAVFILVYLVNPAGAFKKDKDFVNVTVVVHGAEGPSEKILRGQGMVVIEFDQKTEKEKINDDGEAIFTTIPSEWLDQKVKIYLEHPQPYQSLRPDSLFQLKADGKVYVAATLKNADRLFGTITNANNGQFLDSVRVSIRNTAVYTDVNGWFDLHIPAEIQHKFQRVTLSKKEFETVTFDSVPVHTQQEFSYSLSKLKIKKK